MGDESERRCCVAAGAHCQATFTKRQDVIKRHSMIQEVQLDAGIYGFKAY